MPGHKRNLFDDTIPYNIDLTEIYGFDNLHGAEGCIKNVADSAAKLYSVNKAYLLINGATGGILSSIRALTKYGDTVIVERNCHKSVYNAIELCGLKPVYALPEIDSKFGIFSSVTAIQIEELLIRNHNASLVILTSPTYEGVVSDIKSISKVCKKYGVNLFVDEAHGAHFPFSDKFPQEAVNCGADVAVVSLHKTLPSLTQTALLLTNDNTLQKQIEENLAVFESSSPSYILMSAIEKCLDFIKNNQIKFNDYTNYLSDFFAKSSKLKNLTVICSSGYQKNHSFFDFDISKIIISTANTGITGEELAKVLRDNYQIETEMAYTNYVIAMTSVCDTESGFVRLYEALFEIDKTLNTISDKYADSNYCTSLPQKIFDSCQKANYSGEVIPLKNAEGKISLEYVWAYPPGIPLLVPGERIGKREINQLYSLSGAGVELFSTYNNIPENISVANAE